MSHAPVPSVARVLALLTAAGLILAACAPSAPTPAKPAEAPKPAAPAPAASPATAPSPSPSASPAAAPAGAAPAAAAATNVDTRAIADFFTGKTIRIIVGFAAGGGYDVYARLIARFLGGHIPGNPTIVVENQVGAGSLLAANTAYKSAPKDGTTIVHFIGGLITQKLVVENPAVEFDPAQFNWLGAPTPDTGACAVRKEAGFNSLEEARTKQLVLGGTAPGSTTDDIGNTLKSLGLNIKLIDGYDGTAKIRLAADGGEVMGGCWGWESIQPTWKEALDKGEVKIIGQGGPKPHPDLKDVPMMQSLARNDEERRLIQAGIIAPGQITRGFALPPGVPPDRVQALRDAFMDTLKDPSFLTEAQKGTLAINPVLPQEFYDRIKELQDLPPDLKKRLKETLAG